MNVTVISGGRALSIKGLVILKILMNIFIFCMLISEGLFHSSGSSGWGWTGQRVRLRAGFGVCFFFFGQDIDTYVDDIHVTVLSQSCFLMHSCQMTGCTEDFK